MSIFDAAPEGRSEVTFDNGVATFRRVEAGLPSAREGKYLYRWRVDRRGIRHAKFIGLNKRYQQTQGGLTMAEIAHDINSAFYPIRRFLRYMEDPNYEPGFFLNEIDKWTTANSSNRILPDWAKLSLKTASWGHNYFPDPKNGDTRHVIGSFLMAEKYGALKAWDITSANEYYGFIMHDLWPILIRQERDNWAMEDKDFTYNYCFR